MSARGGFETQKAETICWRGSPLRVPLNYEVVCKMELVQAPVHQPPSGDQSGLFWPAILGPELDMSKSS